MGLPLSPVDANLLMEAFEQRALESAALRPRLWVRRYICAVATQRRRIGEVSFTPQQAAPVDPVYHGEKKRKQDSILLVQVENKAGKISTEAYRKSTHKYQHINFASPPILIQIGVIICLRDGAEKICNEEHVRTEKQHLDRVFQTNGYPNGLVHKELYRCRQPQPTTTSTGEGHTGGEAKDDLPPLPTANLEHIQQVCGWIGVRAIFKSYCNL